jgi:hypothetical protein
VLPVNFAEMLSWIAGASKIVGDALRRKQGFPDRTNAEE